MMLAIHPNCMSIALVRRWDTFRKIDQNWVYPDAPKCPISGILQCRERVIISRCEQSDGPEYDRNHGSGYRPSLCGMRHYLGARCHLPIPRAQNRQRIKDHAAECCSRGRCVSPSTGQFNAYRVQAFPKTQAGDRWSFGRIYLKTSLSGLNRKSLFNHI